MTVIIRLQIDLILITYKFISIILKIKIALMKSDDNAGNFNGWCELILSLSTILFLYLFHAFYLSIYIYFFN